MNGPRRRSAVLPRPRKRFGQHFLVDNSVLTDIAARVTATPEDLVLEIGPGRGALTEPLLRGLERLVAVEIDRDLCEHLRQRFPEPGLRLIEGDFLQLDLPALLQEEQRSSLYVAANLPYNITAPVLFRLREHAGVVRCAILTLQKEVAERLVAGPGTKAYSQVSVLLGQCARIRLVRQIPRTAFRPQPKVDSAVIELTFQPNLVPVDNLKLFQTVVRAAFSQRRKMLRNVLRSLPAPSGEGALALPELEGLAADAGIDLTQRAEDLSIGQFARFTAVLGGAGPAA